MDMKKHLPHVDLEKLGKILEIKEEYQRGDISLEEGRTRIREQVGKIYPYEIALAEQELKTIEENECHKEDIQKMIELFDEVMDTSRPNLPLNHPIMCYYRENDEMRRFMLSIEDLVQYPIIKNQWLELYDQIAAFRTHLSRKQNQLYSILEQKGFDRPTTTMWLLDDFVRDEIRDAKNLIEEDKEEEFLAMQSTIVADVRDLLQKEESVLYPTALAMITPEEFEQMRPGDYEIGFAWIDVENFQNTDKTEPQSTTVPDGFTSELNVKDTLSLRKSGGRLMITQDNFNLEYTDPIEVYQIRHFVCKEICRQIHRYIKAMSGSKQQMLLFEEHLQGLSLDEKETTIAQYLDLNRKALKGLDMKLVLARAMANYCDTYSYLVTLINDKRRIVQYLQLINDIYIRYHTVFEENGKFGITDYKGNVIVSPKYEFLRTCYMYVGTFQILPIIAQLEGKMGVILPDGKDTIVIPFDYDSISLREEPPYFDAKRKGRHVYLNMDGSKYAKKQVEEKEKK